MADKADLNMDNEVQGIEVEQGIEAPNGEHEAEGSADSNMWLCRICMKGIFLPVAAIPCGHIFCYWCIFQLMQRFKICPICAMPMHSRNSLLRIHGSN